MYNFRLLAASMLVLALGFCGSFVMAQDQAESTTQESEQTSPQPRQDLHSRVQEVPDEPVTMELENGLRVVLRPMPTAHRYSMVTLFDIGSQHDPAGKSGLGHLCEHLFLSAATENTPATNAETLQRRYPSELNTNTQDHYSMFSVVFPPGRLEQEIDLLADRFRQLIVSREDLDRELPRIETELDTQFKDNVLFAVTAYGVEAHQPLAGGGRRGGIVEELATISVGEVQSRLDTYYKPANASVIVVGPMNLEVMQEFVTEKLGGLDSGTKIEPVDIPPSNAGNTVEMSMEAANPPTGRPMVSFTYDAPAPNDPLYPAFMMQTARLMIMSQMLQTQMPLLPVSFQPVRRPGFVQIFLEAESDEKIPEVIEQLNEFVSAQTQEPISQQLLSVTADRLGRSMGMIKIADQAWTSNPSKLGIQIGRTHQMGIDKTALVQAMQEVTEEQMAETREKYFDASKRTTLIIKTKPTEDEQPAESTADEATATDADKSTVEDDGTDGTESAEDDGKSTGDDGADD